MKGYLIILSICVLLVKYAVCVSAEDLPKCQETEITSNRMEYNDERHVFEFYENVRVYGENLSVICDYLEVYTEKTIVPNQCKADSTIDKKNHVSISQINAVGNVKIEQAGRIANCGRAEILLKEGKLLLMENPVVIDSNGKVEGYRITLFREDKKAFVEPFPNGGRAKVTLPSIPDLGFKPDSKAIKSDQNADSTSVNGMSDVNKQDGV